MSSTGLSDADQAALRSLAKTWDEVGLSGDFDRGAATLTDDFTLVLPEQGPVDGKAAWRELANTFPKMVESDTTIEEIDGGGDIAFVRGRSAIAFEIDGGVHRNTSRYLVICRRQADGSWLASREVVNFETPLNLG